MKIIKDIIETTANNHGLTAFVVGADDMLVVSRKGYWPVSIPIVSLIKYPRTNEAIIERLKQKLMESGIIK